MMKFAKCIYKYPLKITDLQLIEIEPTAKFLCLKEQNDVPVLYYLVNPRNQFVLPRVFMILGTGHPISEDDLAKFTYIDSVVCNNSGFVWHVFEKIISR